MKTNVQNTKFQTPNTSKGITLVALVITIIVLLILAGVAINMAINSDGLFGKANEAVEGWNTAVEEESTAMQDLLDELEIWEKVEGSSDEWRVEGTTIVEYLGDKTEIVIPNYVDGIAVKTIGDSLFVGDTSITSITISNGIEVIGTGAFANCSGLRGNLIIPDSVITINNGAFAYAGLNGTLTIGKRVKSIGNSAFACPGFIGDLIIPDSVEFIDMSAFSGFTNNLIIGEGITALEANTFGNCGFKGTLEIRSKLETIGNVAFQNQKFSGNFVLPNSVKSIADFAFQNCSEFSSITIPSTVSTVGYYAFHGVKQIYYEGSLKSESWGAVNIN